MPGKTRQAQVGGLSVAGQGFAQKHSSKQEEREGSRVFQMNESPGDQAKSIY
jgi:hypothetical protein